MSEDSTSIGRVLLPVNRDVSLRVVVFAISLALLALVAGGFIWFSETILDFDGPGTAVVYLLCSVAITGAIVNGYFNDDLLVSCGIAIAPLVGFALFPATIWLLTDMSALSTTGSTALRAGAICAVVGSVGGLVGVWAGRRYGGGRSSPNLD